MRKVLVIGLFIGFCSYSSSAQELNFSQFFNIKQYYNPIDAASFEGTDAYLIYRNQWQGLPNPFTSSQFSASHGILKNGDPEEHLGGIGIEVHNFNSGPGNYNVLGASVSPAYNVFFNQSKSSKAVFGLKLGYEQRSIGINDLTWGNQYNPNIGFDASLDPNEPNFGENVSAITVGAGAGYYFNHKSNDEISHWSFHIKAAGLNLNKPEYNLSGVKTASEIFITSEIGLHYLIHEHYLIGTDILYLKQGDNELINPGLNLSYIINKNPSHNFAPTWVKVGASFRLDNAYMGLIGIGNGLYRIHFSYDLSSNSLSDASSNYNAYEISLGFRFIKKKHTESIKYNNNHNPRI